MQAASSASAAVERHAGHAVWVRVGHWVLASTVLVLATTGTIILMAHPRLYWGNVGNDLTPALVELPLGRNHWHTTWSTPVPFYPAGAGPVSALRTYDIYNENSWARSLHFLGAWILLGVGCGYAVTSVITGHLGRDLLPRLADLDRQALRQALSRRAHQDAKPGPPYNVLQRAVYTGVLLAGLPVMVVSGMAMSPALTAAYPLLLELFGGSQSARTVHFAMCCLLLLFTLGHVSMTMTSGLRRQLRAMTIGMPA